MTKDKKKKHKDIKTYSEKTKDKEYFYQKQYGLRYGQLIEPLLQINVLMVYQ